MLHKYLVGDQETMIWLTFKPGSLNFKCAMCILALWRDGTYLFLEKPRTRVGLFGPDKLAPLILAYSHVH
jgi:hypothetical protein